MTATNTNQNIRLLSAEILSGCEDLIEAQAIDAALFKINFLPGDDLEWVINKYIDRVNNRYETHGSSSRSRAKFLTRVPIVMGKVQALKNIGLRTSGFLSSAEIFNFLATGSRIG